MNWERMRRIFGWLLWIQMICLAVLVFATGLAAYWSRLEPLSNLRVLLAGALLMGSLTCFAGMRLSKSKSKWAKAATWVCLVLAFWGLLPALSLLRSDGPAVDSEAVPLRIGSVNLLFGIAHPKHVRPWMAEENLDIACFVEMKLSERSKLRWPRLLASWKDEYPHQYVFEHDYYGMAVLARTPLDNVEPQFSEDSLGKEHGRPIAVWADLEWQGRRVHFGLIHPPRPQDSWRLEVRHKFFGEVATRVGDEGSWILIGDFNTTEGSPVMRNLLARTGLRDSRAGHGYCPTWSPHWFSLPLVPLDHILVRGPAVLSRGVGPPVRSDHRPIHAVLAWPKLPPVAPPPR